jgi:hypothetical protein
MNTGVYFARARIQGGEISGAAAKDTWQVAEPLLPKGSAATDRPCHEWTDGQLVLQ